VLAAGQPAHEPDHRAAWQEFAGEGERAAVGDHRRGRGAAVERVEGVRHDLLGGCPFRAVVGGPRIRPQHQERQRRIHHESRSCRSGNTAAHGPRADVDAPLRGGKEHSEKMIR